MKNVVFLEKQDGTLVFFDWEVPGSGVVTERRHPSQKFLGLRNVINDARFRGRVKAYSLSNNTQAPENPWNVFKCSGCFRPIQASRWYVYEELGGFGGHPSLVRKMTKPRNGIGKFKGSSKLKLDKNHFKPKTPNVLPVAPELNNECWLNRPCHCLWEFYDVDSSLFTDE